MAMCKVLSSQEFWESAMQIKTNTDEELTDGRTPPSRGTLFRRPLCQPRAKEKKAQPRHSMPPRRERTFSKTPVQNFRLILISPLTRQLLLPKNFYSDGHQGLVPR